MEGEYPELEDTEDQREGTAAHHYVSEGMLGRTVKVGDLAPNGHPITAEMVDHGDLFIKDMVREIALAAAAPVPHFLWHVETKVHAYGSIHPDVEGTPDGDLIDWVRKLIILWDYKYGHGYVDPYRNPQLGCYLGGLIDAHNIDLRDGWRVIFRVVQPRNYTVEGPIRSWAPNDVGEMLDLIGELRQSAYLAKLPGAHTTTGPHCKNCLARHACETFKRVSDGVVDMSGQATPLNLPGDALGQEIRTLRAAKARLEARLDGLEQEALARVMRSEPVRFWTLGRGDTHPRWALPDAQVVAMGAILGTDLRSPKPVTPAQAAKMGFDEAVIKLYSRKPPGALKLVPMDEKAATKAFGKGPTT